MQVRASFWFLICSFLQKGISTLSTPIFTRIMSTAEYGQYGAFNSWLNVVTVLVTLRLYSGVYTQGLVKFSDDRAVFSSSLQGLTTSLTLGFTIVYLLFRDFWNGILSLTTVQVLSMLVMIWATAAFNFWAAEQRVRYSYRSLVLVTLIVSVAKPVIGVVFVLHAEDKVTARILGLVLVELIGYIGLYAAQMRRGKAFYSARFWRYALLFNLPLVPHYLSQTVLSSSDRIMIKRLVGDDQAGFYNLAYQVSSIMTLFNTALTQTLSPWMYQKIKEKRTRDIAPIAYLTLGIIALVNVLLILLAPEAVAVFAPKRYAEAIYVIPPVAMGCYFMYSYDLFAKHAFYYEKTGFVMAASVFGAALNIVLNYIFIRIYGYIAAGYTTLVCYLVYSAGHYMFMRRICRTHCDGVYPYDTRVIAGISLAFMAVSFAMLLTYPHPLVRYAIVALIAAACVVERRRIAQIVRRIGALRRKKHST